MQRQRTASPAAASTGTPTTIGIVGGGQLGRMLTLAALPLGFRVIAINPSPGSPAKQVGAEEIVADLYDRDALRQLAEAADYITVEIEHLDAAALAELADAGTPVNPAPQTIAMIQDKYQQKVYLQSKGIPVAAFSPIETPAQVAQLLRQSGGRMLVKTRLGAYDGRGNALVTSQVELTAALERFKNSKVYAETVVPFTKELAVMVARSLDGEVAVYPVVETVHERNICVEVTAPAEIPEAARYKALELAARVAEVLEGAGVFGIEMFLGADGEVLVNEIAPRVHNSGHYTMDACRTGQFEQHMRAISGLPLGATDLLTPAAVMVNILGERDGPTQIIGLQEVLRTPHTSVHLYGKSPTKVDRKMGHITATGKTPDEARQRARSARKKLQI